MADDPEARQVLDTLAAGIASQILARLSDFYPEPVDQIILTGRLCLSIALLDRILEKLTLVSPDITVFPGSHEADALCNAALRIYKNIDTPARWETPDS
jgi:butyrate kinase